MTASIMRYCKKLIELFLCFTLLVPVFAQAGEISLRNVQISANSESYLLSADVDIQLNARLEDAVARGVVLYFLAEFELERSRWYWFDEQVVRSQKTVQLSYHALTRQYRLSTGGLHQSFDTLSGALRTISRLRNWAVLDKSAVNPEQTYRAALRVRLDLTQMPKTFQVTALANRDWHLSSEWLRWNVIPAELAKQPSETTPAPVLKDAVPAASGSEMSPGIVPVVAPAGIQPSGDAR